MATCESIGLPFAPITKPDELFDDPHLNQSGNLLDTTLPGGEGKTCIPVLPLTIDGNRTKIRLDLPERGEYRPKTPEDLGYSKS